MSQTRKKMGIAAVIMVVSVFMSRILGYVRDAVIAYTQGAHAGTDAYFAAFTIPDFLNYLLAGASLSITFIPIYAAYMSRDDREGGNLAFSAIFCILSLCLVILVIVGEVFTDRLVPFIAPGFQGEQITVTARLTRIVMPAQIFFYTGGLFMAVQYARGKFFIPALAPLIYNTGIIAGGLLLGKKIGMEGFAWGVLAGSFVGNFLLQLLGAYAAGLRIRFSFDLKHPGFREFLRLSIPIMLGFSLVFVDEWMSRIFGSFLVAGAITWLNNARRLAQVPIGVLGQASGVAAYPFLAEQAAKGKIRTMFNDMSATLDWVFFSSSLAACLVFLFSREVVLIVFKRGAFSIHDTVNTASALAFFALGVPFWCSQNIVARGFFAMKDTLTPTIVGSVAWVLTLPAYYFLMVRFGVNGLAAASTIGITIHTLFLYAFLLRKTNIRLSFQAVKVPLISTILCSLVIAGTRGLLKEVGFLPPWDYMSGALVRLGVGTVIISLLFLLTGFMLRLGPARTILGKVLPVADNNALE
jgi:putative peptidoglycan lipid II flippase